MDQIRITGGQKLNGTISISGAKNAALPLMIASLLTRETLTLANLPRLADVAMLKRILGNHGVDCMVLGKRAGQNGFHGESIELRAGDIVDTTAPYDLVSRMRASFWVIGPLVARMGEARDVVEGQRLLREEAGDHQRQGGVLGAGNLNSAVEAVAADDADSIHEVAPSRRLPANRPVTQVGRGLYEDCGPSKETAGPDQDRALGSCGPEACAPSAGFAAALRRLRLARSASASRAARRSLALGGGGFPVRESAGIGGGR